MVCFQYKSDAIKFQAALIKRLAKFSLKLGTNKTRLVEFGRFSSKYAKKKNEKMETIYFLGFTHFCTRNSQGNFMVGRKTEKNRLRRSIQKITDKMREIRHRPKKDQCLKINEMFRGHYNYGMGGNKGSLFKAYRKTEKFWSKMLCSRSWKSYIDWDKYHEIKKVFPILRPKILISYEKMKDAMPVNQTLRS